MASADYNVVTPERVKLQYDIAGIGSRGAAAIIDTFLQSIALYVLLVFVVTSGYYVFFEIVWNGQTPGKRLVGVRVIRENGYPIRPIDAVIRNLVRIVDWLPLFYGVGMLVMLLNGRARRLGDFASGTIVVRERSPLMPTALSGRGHGPALAPAGAALVRDFLAR